MKNQFGTPIVQGAGHISVISDKSDKSLAKCAIYKDNKNNIYCTAQLIPLNEYLKGFGKSMSDFIYI